MEGAHGKGWWAGKQERRERNRAVSEATSQATGPLPGFPMRSSYCKHQCVCGPYVSNCVGGAEGSGEDVIFGQERDTEAEEGSILATECEKRWIQEGPFNAGTRSTESAV